MCSAMAVPYTWPPQSTPNKRKFIQSSAWWAAELSRDSRRVLSHNYQFAFCSISLTPADTTSFFATEM